MGTLSTGIAIVVGALGFLMFAGVISFPFFKFCGGFNFFGTCAGILIDYNWIAGIVLVGVAALIAILGRGRRR